jgi:hypothetical protein
MWCDGKRVDKPKYGYRRDKQSDELTLSMRQKFTDGKTEYLVSIGGQKSFGRRIEKPKPSQKVEVEFGPLTINKPVEIKSVGGSAIVWAMGAGNGASLDKQDEVERMLKTAPWLLILRLRAESEE